MTVVLARRFDKRIIVMSDTMISNRGAASLNVFPGRLKSIVVNNWLTISYAGLSTQAVDVIRYLSKIPHLTTNSAISYLLDANSFHTDEIDFIVCSHETEARLLKISNGSIYEGEDYYWIGNPTAANEILNNQQKLPKSEKIPDYIAHEELELFDSFQSYLSEGNGISHEVGGAAINCLCSDYGHCYQPHANVFAWDTIILGQTDMAERNRLGKTGLFQFGYNFCAPAERGQAIVGLYFDQSNTGYIYDPLIRDEALKINDISLSDFSQLISSEAEQRSKIKIGNANA